MSKNPTAKELKRILEDIYNDFSRRIRPENWQQPIRLAYEAASGSAAAAVVEFLRDHRNMPASVWRAVCHSIKLRDHPVVMTDIYGVETVCGILNDMSRQDVINYSYLPGNIDEDTVKIIIKSAGDAELYLDRGQIFLAGRKIDELNTLCPGHPDVRRMSKRYADIRANAGLPVERLRHIVTDSETNEPVEEGLALMQSDKTNEALKYFEELISKDYGNYGAYFPLGQLYLMKGDLKKADYVAELLLDLGKDRSNAAMLKGMVLEKQGKMDDAFFFYCCACGEDSENSAAGEHRAKLLKKFTDRQEDLQVIGSAFNALNHILYKKEEKMKYPRDIPDHILDFAEKIDAIIKKGRLTEGYYELTKKMGEEPESSFIVFRCALALYTMKKDVEAREMLKRILPEDEMYERARWLTEDIENSIVAKRAYEDVEPLELSEIFFNTGKYEDSLKILNRLGENDMGAKDYVLKGKCEIETGRLNAASESFTRALYKDFSVKNVREILGMIYQIKGDTEKALEMYESAISSGDDPLTSCEQKALILYEQGRNEELLDFRPYARELTGGASEVDGYSGMVYLNDYPRNVFVGLRYLEEAVAEGASRKEFFGTLIAEYIKKDEYFKALMFIETAITVIGTGDSEGLMPLKAEALFMLGKVREASLLTAKLMNTDPDNARLHHLNGMISANRDDEKETLRWFSSAVRIDPDNHGYVFDLAERYNKAGDRDKALEYYTRAIVLDSGDSVSYKRRAEIYVEKAESRKALDDVNASMQLTPDDPELYVIIGNIISEYEMEDELELELGDSGTDTDPSNAGGLSAVPSASGAGTAAAGNEADGAESAEGEDKEPSSEQKLMFTEEKLREDSEKDSEYYFTKAISIDSKCTQAYISRARLYAVKGDTDKALKDINTAIELDDGRTDSHIVRGIIYYLSGKNEEADNDFTRVLELDDQSFVSYSYKARCLNSMERYIEAINICNKGIEVNPDFMNLYVNRGVAYYNTQNYDDALEDFRRVIIRRNEVGTSALSAAYRYMGMSFEKTGMIKDAVNSYNKLLVYEPDSADIKERVEELENRLEEEKPKSLFDRLRRKK